MGLVRRSSVVVVAVFMLIFLMLPHAPGPTPNDSGGEAPIVIAVPAVPLPPVLGPNQLQLHLDPPPPLPPPPPPRIPPAPLKLALHAIHSDNAVIQADEPFCIWGWAARGKEPVMVLIAENRHTGGTAITRNSNLTAPTPTESRDAPAGLRYSWQVCFPPRPASTNVHRVVARAVASPGEDLPAISNVLFGDVWICSGQSNMQLSLRYLSDQPPPSLFPLPWLRLFHVPNDLALVDDNSPVPHSARPRWSTVRTAADVSVFSGLCFWFAVQLSSNLAPLEPGSSGSSRRPIALVQATYKASHIDQWVAEETGCSRERHRCLSVTGKGDPNAQFVQYHPPNGTGVLFRRLLLPLTRNAARGVLWYQGESDSHQPEMYACAFPQLVLQWRRAWQRSMPFLFVQIHPWPAAHGMLPYLRHAQLSALAQPAVRMVSAVHLGDPASPKAPIHPRYKKEIAMRLAEAACEFVPCLVAPIEPVEIEPAISGEQLVIRLSSPVRQEKTSACTSCCESSLVAMFAVCPDGPTSPFDNGPCHAPELVSLEDSGTLIKIRPGALSPPLWLRHLWEDYPQCVLKTSSGAVLAPFARRFN
eukprot:TRINITY_DN3839_c0_g1_i1.p1 TRINITY_DN3839_c0_g1~~TRINITY_DN3839_c0_g1_i1.p1  ORF type:complete len:587 (-),score=45.32 TRINITY_DN3839_c0_g1_i1:111-1871(-)